MSTNIATFRDYKPGHVRRRTQQPVMGQRDESVVSDMADGNLVTEFFFKFAKFDYAASSLILTLIGILGDGEQGIKLFDEDIAEIATCSDRTVRRWRADYLAQAKKHNFFPLEIIEGEYDHTKQRYLPTFYRITFADALEDAVSTARARADYQTDRLKAIEEAAKLHYDDIDQAPPRMRTRKPRKAAQTPLAQLRGASKKLASAQTSLEKMPSRQRAAFVNGQGEELRATLEALRQQIADLESCLSDENLSVENTEVETHRTSVSGIPPEDGSRDVGVRVKEEDTRTPAAEIEHAHSPEYVAAWDRTFACLSQPKTARAEVEIQAHPSRRPSLEEDEPLYKVGAEVFPVTIIGERLHDEPSPVAEIRPSSSGWQYRLEGFSEWRDEGLLQE